MEVYERELKMLEYEYARLVEIAMDNSSPRLMSNIRVMAMHMDLLKKRIRRG